MSIPQPSLFFPSPFSISSLKSPTLRLTPQNPNFISPSNRIIHRRNLSILAEAKAIPLLSFEGSRIGEVFLNLKVAKPETARAVVHRGIVTELRNKRRGTASTKGRGEVRGGGRKPYPQKGTGRARCGSIRSPLHRGGGRSHGPKPKDWSIKINRKEKKLAISTALHSAVADSFAVEEFHHKFDKPRTKDFLAAMARWGLDPYKKVMFFVRHVSDNVRLSSRNIGTVSMLSPKELCLFNILDASKLVFTPRSVKYLNFVYGPRRDGIKWDEDDAYEVDHVDEDEDECDENEDEEEDEGDYIEDEEEDVDDDEVDGGCEDEGES